MRSTSDVAIIGSGSLARWTCHALATGTYGELCVGVIARDLGKATTLCQVAQERARTSGTPVFFRAVACALARRDEVARILAGLRPDCVLLCASTQSPWETQAAPSQWTDLVTRAGFGVTVPLHAELARVVGQAVSPGVAYLNACYPDAVNPLLNALGIPVLSGVGNVASLAATLQDGLSLADQQRLRVLAHHAHLSPPAPGVPEARAWLDAEPIPDVTARLARHRATSRKALNRVTGATAARLMAAVVTGADTDANLPGPLGLPGGYPVRLHERKLWLRLPAGVPESDAIAFNQRAALADGAVVAHGRVVLSATAESGLRAVAPALAAGYDVADLDAVTADLHHLRDLLRGHRASPRDTPVPLQANQPEMS
ncbi:potassium transporter TrkA [Amycolatopsis sp. H6(2020)]|nr:potassium transporter TrkA [Amycolatopsis sp. H6(2020)]